MKRDTLAWLACMLVASVGLVACLWVVPYIPTPDGPQHVYSAHVENHFSDAGSIYAEYYRVLPQFAGKGFALVFGPLESVLPWRLALRVALSVMALAFAWGFALVVLALDRERRSFALLGFLIALPWSLYMGFFAFVIGTTVGLYALAYVLHRPPTTTARCGLLAFVLLVQGVCHVFSAVMTGTVITAFVVLRAPSGARLRELGRMTLVGVPAAALLALTFAGRNMGAPALSKLEWEVATRPSEISRWFVPGPGFRGWLVLGLAAAGVATALARWQQGRRRDASGAGGAAMEPEAALAWIALALLVLTALSPVHIPGWQLFAPRFAIVAVVLGLAVLRLPDGASPRVASAVAPVLTLCCLASNVVSAKLHHRLADGCADSLAALDAPLHFAGPRWPILLDGYCGAPEDRAASPVPWAAEALNVNLLYLIDHGGVAAKLFNGAPSIHAIDIRADRMPRPPDSYAQSVAVTHYVDDDPKVRASVLTALASDGMRYEGIHVVGARSADFAVFEDRGYVAEYRNDSMLIARFEGCPSELVLPAGALDGDPVFYEYGLFSKFVMNDEIRTLGHWTEIPRDTPVRDGLVHVALPARPCGAVWVRVVWDADRSSTFTPGDRTCEKSAWEGRLVTTVDRQHPAVRCTPSASPR